MADLLAEKDTGLKWHESAIRRSLDLSVGQEIPLDWLSKEYPSTPIVVGRNPDSHDPKYDQGRLSLEIHVKLRDKNGANWDVNVPRRSLKIVRQSSGICQITNLSETYSPRYGFGDRYHNLLATGSQIEVGGKQDIRNFWIEIGKGAKLRTGSVSETGGQNSQISSLIFQKTEV